MRVNMIGTANMLEAARINQIPDRVDRLLNLRSLRVHGVSFI